MRSNNQQINNTRDAQFWKPPPNGIFKAILDASGQFSEGVGMGVMFRNFHRGNGCCNFI